VLRANNAELSGVMWVKSIKMAGTDQIHHTLPIAFSSRRELTASGDPEFYD